MTTLSDPPKMQTATKATHVEPVIRGPKKVALASGALAGVATAFMGGAVMLAQPLAAPVLALMPWLPPVLVIASLLTYTGSAVTAALAGIDAPKPPTFPTTKKDDAP